MSEKSLVARAQAAVGDTDTIIAAAAFQPKGARGAMAGGFVGGEAIGHLAGGGLGGAVLGVAGELAAAKIAEKHAGGHVDGSATENTLTFESLLAVSETRLYGWHLHHGLHTGAGEAIFALDRADVTLEVRNMVDYHTLTVTDLHSGEHWQFQAEHMVDHSRAFFDALHPVEV